jgi:hypothetical protein
MIKIQINGDGVNYFRDIHFSADERYLLHFKATVVRSGNGFEKNLTVVAMCGIKRA